jgi:predicted TIM-barrel fold metal-dependent hydrolase
MPDQTRRTILRGISALGVGSLGLGKGAKAELPDVFPNSSGIDRPSLIAPALACDSHIHIYSRRFPILDGQASLPLNATVDDYRRIQQRLGTTRTVVVQPANYKTDNRVTLDAIAQLGVENARGIAVVTPEVTDRELQRMHDGGIRGIRFSLFQPKHALTRVDMIAPLAQRVHALGWHIQLQMRADLIVENASLLQSLPCPVVFDHMARLPPPVLGSAAHQVILKLLDSDRAWVKVSAAYLNTAEPAKNYQDTIPIATSLIEAAPERMVWGSDWPHPTESKHKPDDATLFDLLSQWAPDEMIRHRILVENPARLYGFSTSR